MQYCQKCRISIRGNKRCCPLCQSNLSGQPEEEVFPDLGQKKVSSVMLTRICTFLLICFEIVLLAAQLISGFKLEFVPGWAFIGLLVWVNFMIFMYYHNDILKALNVQGYLIIIGSVAADWFTGMRGWSLAWVIPLTFFCMVILSILVAKGLGMTLNEYLVIIAGDMLMSMLQIIPVLLGWNPYRGPAVICVAFMLILTAFMLIFRYRALQTALEKLFNM